MDSELPSRPSQNLERRRTADVFHMLYVLSLHLGEQYCGARSLYGALHIRLTHLRLSVTSAFVPGH
jgi:hypothetical protein